MNNEKYTCEWCGKIYTILDNNSKRFCSLECKKKYIGKKISDKAKKRISEGTFKSNFTVLSKGDWKCPHCEFIGQTKSKLKLHQKKEHPQFCVEGGWCKGLTKETSATIKNISEKLKDLYKSGKLISPLKGKKLSVDTKKKISDYAISHNYGGFVKHKKFDYNGIKLDSSYEVELAKSLDKNNVKWQRCKRFPYHMNGKLHHYTPDFFLPDYNIYLDPKNDFLIESINPVLGYKDVDKIHQVELENNVRILVLNKNQLNWEYIQQHL